MAARSKPLVVTATGAGIAADGLAKLMDACAMVPAAGFLSFVAGTETTTAMRVAHVADQPAQKRPLKFQWDLDTPAWDTLFNSAQKTSRVESTPEILPDR